MIPTRFILSGDTEFAKKFIGEGRSHLAKLLHALSYRQLPTASPPSIYIGGGVSIRCVVNYGLTEIYIHANMAEDDETVDQGSAGCYYFIRIKSSDPEPYPIDLDPATTPGVDMDRIIVYEMALDGGDTQDPGDDSCRGWQFTPGGGRVICDVDIANDTIYLADGPFADGSVLEKMRELATRTPTNANPSPAGSLTDIGAVFVRGRMSDPHKNAIMASLAAPAATTTYDVTYRYNVSGYSWPVMVDRCHGLMEAETPSIPLLTIANGIWGGRWNPSLGGDPLRYINAHNWPGLDDSAAFYGECCYYVDDTVSIVTKVGSNGYQVYDPYSGDYLYTSTRNATVETFKPVLQDGFFFAPTTNVDTSVFFTLFTSGEPGWRTQRAQVFGGDDLPGGGVEALHVFGDVIADFSNSSEPISIRQLVTPLETLEYDDFIAESSQNTLPCSEHSWFQKYHYMVVTAYAHNPYGIGYHYLANDYLHYPVFNEGDPENINNVQLYTLFKHQGKADTHRLSSFHAVEVSSGGVKKTFASMLIFLEKRATARQGRCVPSGSWLWGAPEPYTDCRCSGQTYSSPSLLPVGNYSAVGVVIYLFAPTSLYRKDSDGAVVQFWDIHSARRSSAIINPYRCLGLEEYMNEVFVNIQSQLDANTEIGKLSSGLGFTMNYYGFGITDGFVAI